MFGLGEGPQLINTVRTKLVLILKGAAFESRETAPLPCVGYVVTVGVLLALPFREAGAGGFVAPISRSTLMSEVIVLLVLFI
jgi:hypothetical protein